MLFKGKLNKREIVSELIKVLKNPSLIAVYIGIVILIFDIKLPSVLAASASTIGSMTAPLSMIIVGALSCKINIKEHLIDWTVYYGIAIKLMIIPTSLYLIALIINDNSIVANTVILLASMPAAAMTSIFADSFDLRSDYASVIVVATTLLSVFSIPILIRMLI